MIRQILALATVLLLAVAPGALAQDVCEGNFDCDQDNDVDGTDAAVFKADFGRGGYNDPCPGCYCPYEMLDCGTKCVDPMTDEDYCGAIEDCLDGNSGIVCGAGEICESGTCILNCLFGLINCDGKCVDPETDEEFCGSCTNSCASGEMCVDGSCETWFTFFSPAPVPKTGQTTSYATGDDGDLDKGVIWPNPRFTDNSDGTVRDNLTGLIWLKNANCFGQRTWNDALSDCNGLASDSCGLTDGSSAGEWRLPNKRELSSLYYDGAHNPGVPDTLGTGQWSEGDLFNNLQSTWYLSSTTYHYNDESAIIVSMNESLVAAGLKTNSYYVLPVRDPL